MSELSPAVGLTEIELASGFVGGSGDDGERLPPAEPGRTALEALEAAILPALQRGLCTVSFSGGRDSSIVLAAAVRVARAHGLPLPVPVTMRFGHAPQTEESEWQELVVSHLGLSDWQKLEVGDEVDYLGPYAQRLLLAHGVLYPFNAHSHGPTAEVSRGGTVLTGYGGDDVMMAWRWQRELALLTGRARLRARDLPRLAYFASPLPLRRLVAGRKLWRPAWLTPLGVRMLRKAVAGDAGEPRGFAKRVAWLHRRRYLALGRRSYDLVGAEWDARIEHPLVDPGFLAAVARDGGHTGFGDRTRAMRQLFDGVLPDALLARPTKAVFGEVFYGRHSEAFLANWDGPAPFPDLVAAGRLRSAWANGDYRTPRLLLQASWLAANRPPG